MKTMLMWKMAFRIARFLPRLQEDPVEVGSAVMVLVLRVMSGLEVMTMG